MSSVETSLSEPSNSSIVSRCELPHSVGLIAERGTTSQASENRIYNVPDRYPNVKKLVQIAVTIPVTTCSPERSFSAMKILKSRIRPSICDERLHGLALMYIHKDVEVELRKVVENFALKKRKTHFVL